MPPPVAYLIHTRGGVLPCDDAPTTCARCSSPMVRATATSTGALATMRAEPQHSVATGVRTSGYGPSGGIAWRQERPSPAHGVGTPSYPANAGISDTTTHATLGPGRNTRTATGQPEQPTHSACVNVGSEHDARSTIRAGAGRERGRVVPSMFRLPFGATSDDVELWFEKSFLVSFDVSRAVETTQHIEC